MRCHLQRTAALLAFVALVTGHGLPPAQAHAGGQAQLYVASARLVPNGGEWSLRVVLRDADSGELQPGFAVTARGSSGAGSAFGPVGLADPDQDGAYDTGVAMTDGAWSFTLEAEEVPGGAAALPVQRTWNIVLRPGEPLDIVGTQPSRHHGRSGGLPVVPAVLVGAAGAAVLIKRTSRPRSVPVPGG